MRKQYRPSLRLHTCAVCGDLYTRSDDRTFRGGERDADWHPRHGRCYGCYLGLCYEVFGGLMDPCFVIGGTAYMPDEVLPARLVVGEDDGLEGGEAPGETPF